MSGLTTHVLDTAHGCAAAGVVIELYQINAQGKILISTHTTNADGRVDGPLLSGHSIQVGHYELVFAAGDYFARRGTPLPSPRFIDKVSIAIGIADVAAHYHVPLLVSPWSYSTYRGS
jgi:5-hydroxyisourate hydrolase